jgi:hypothetical protein
VKQINDIHPNAKNFKSVHAPSFLFLLSSTVLSISAFRKAESNNFLSYLKFLSLNIPQMRKCEMTQKRKAKDVGPKRTFLE